MFYLMILPLAMRLFLGTLEYLTLIYYAIIHSIMSQCFKYMHFDNVSSSKT